MGRWLLNTFPTWALAVLFVGGLALFAVAGLGLVRRRSAGVGRGEHNDAVSLVAQLLVGVYGIVLAFVIVTHYEDFADAERSVETEAVALVQLQRASGAFAPAERDGLRSRIREYVDEVTGDEWRLMRDGEGSAQADEQIAQLYGALQRFAPRGATQSVFYDSAVAKVDDLVAARAERLQHAAHTLPIPFEILIYGGALAFIGMLWFYGTPSARLQGTLVMVVAGLIGFNLLIAALLDHPFSGELTVSTEPFERVRTLPTP